MGAESSTLAQQHQQKRVPKEGRSGKRKKRAIGIGSRAAELAVDEARERRPKPSAGRRRSAAGGGLAETKAMHSPFRGLRRAASSSASSISCCSSASGSGAASAYPYPRTHSTVMVVPSARAPLMPGHIPPSAGSRDWTPTIDDENNNSNEQLLLHFPHLPTNNNNNNNNNEGEAQTTTTTVTTITTVKSTDNGDQQQQQQRQSVVSQYGFQTHRPRPPLNRAIPPIPESRSDESIISTQSARRQSAKEQQLLQQTAQMIDENNPIDEKMEEGEERGEEKRGEEKSEPETGKKKRASRLPKLMRRREKGQRPDGGHEQHAKEPKSPLMSVAHSVKSRLSRLAGSSGARPAKELPVSRSLEIGAKGTRIPQKADEPMSKSWSMGEVPRRGPATTLIPSPGVGRLPPDEDLPDAGRQVQFAPLPCEECLELKRVRELDFVVWTPEKRQPKKAEEKESGQGPGERVQEQKAETEEAVSIVAEQKRHSPSPPPLPSVSPPELTPAHVVSPPKTLTLMRKSPQSFPPLGVLSSEQPSCAAPVRPAKSAMSVSFGAVDVRKAAERQRDGKRKVFSTRSLRMVATRVCEASPLVRRRGRSAGRNDDGEKEREKRESSLFRKRHSVPNEQKATSAKPKSFSGTADGVSRLPVSLRSVKSVNAKLAPLAESESFRVENSPAVEQCPPWEAKTKGGGRAKGGGFVFGRRAEEKGKGKAPLTADPPRPTLAQLLASPLPKKRQADDKKAVAAAAKVRSGLIDDEIDDQPMLISASPPGALGEFRLIDELSTAGPSPASALNGGTSSPSSAPSSVVLVAEQWQGPAAADHRQEVVLVQSRLESTLKLGPTRKRNAARSRADTLPTADRKYQNGHSGDRQGPSASRTAEVGAKRQQPPPDTKSEDGVAVGNASFLPGLLSDFRSDLVHLQESVRRDLEELQMLRLQNAVLREQLAERDRIIVSLQRQLRTESAQ